MGRKSQRIVSVLLMSIVLAVPVLGTVCSLLCEPESGRMRGHHAHGDGAQQAPPAHPGGAHAAHASHSGPVAVHHHAPVAPPVSPDVPRSSAEWTGACCESPSLTLAAMPVVRHELQIDPAVVETAFMVLDGSDTRPLQMGRDTSRAPLPSRHSVLVLRI